MTVYRMNDVGEWVRLPEPEPDLIDKGPTMAELRREAKENKRKSSSHMGNPPLTPPTKIGPRGGRYTMAKTKEGRPYRKYF